MSTGNVSAGIIGVVALTSPLWLFCVAWCVISRSQIKEKMKKGLSFKESVKQVFKESLVNGSGDGSFQHNRGAFDNHEHIERMNSSSGSYTQPQPIQSCWSTDFNNRHLSGNIHYTDPRY